MDKTNDIKPRIGTMAIGLGAYWPQFPGMREQLIGHHERMLHKLASVPCEIVQAGMVDSAGSAKRAGELFGSRDVDGVFCQVTTYANSETLLPAVRDLDVPVVLLNVQAVKALNMTEVRTIKDWLGMGITCAALPEMTAGLHRLGRRFDIITGYLDGDETVDAEIAAWIRALGVRRRLRKQNMGLLGRPFQGMLDLNLDETHILRVFGTFIQHLQWDDIADKSRGVSAETVTANTALLKGIFAIPDGVRASDLENISRILSALSHLVEQHDLCGIASHYDGNPTGTHAEVLAAFNPALSVLNTRGVACPVEGDIKTGLAMLMLKGVGGSANLAELYSMDFQQDVCVIGHSGAGDAAISSRKPDLGVSEVFHGKSGKGYVTQFYPRLGPVTLLSVTQDCDGDYRMIAAEGECVEGPHMALGDTNCRVAFGGGVRQFVNAWSLKGPTHHGVLGLGRNCDGLKKVAISLGIPFEIVCQ